MDLMLPFILAGLGVLLIGLVGYLIYSGFKPVEERDYTEQLDELLGDDDDSNKKENLIQKWNNYWGKLLGESEIDRYGLNDKTTAGREMIMLFVGIFFVSMLLLRNPILPIFIVAVVWYVLVFYVRSTAVRKTKAIDDQLTKKHSWVWLTLCLLLYEKS